MTPLRAALNDWRKAQRCFESATERLVREVSAASPGTTVCPKNIEVIKDVVSAFYDLAPGALESKEKTFTVSHPRQVAMYLARKQTKHSWEQIGRAFGGRAHGTAMHAIEAVEARMATETDYAAEVAQMAKTAQEAFALIQPLQLTA